MAAFQPFNPSYGSGQNVTAAAASGSVTIPRGNYNVRLCNTGTTNPVQVRIGNSANGTVTATAADLHIPPGGVEVVTKSPDDNTVAYISAVGTTLNIMPGEGW